MSDQETTLFGGVAKLGDSRYVWSVSTYDWMSYGEGLPIDSYGYTSAREEAEQALQEAIDDIHTTYPEARFTFPAPRAMWASRRHRQAAAEARAARPAPDSTASTATEYVYRRNVWFDDQINNYSLRMEPHRVIKRTKRFVFVCTDSTDTEARLAQWYAKHPEAIRTVRLDWAALEADGHVWHKGERWYLTPDGCFATPPRYMAVLGITSESTPDEVRRAYRRKARETHPDMGGSAEEFRAVQAAWEQAQAALEAQQ